MNPTLIGMLVMWKFVWDNVALNLLYILLISTKAVKKKKKRILDWNCNSTKQYIINILPAEICSALELKNFSQFKKQEISCLTTVSLLSSLMLIAWRGAWRQGQKFSIWPMSAFLIQIFCTLDSLWKDCFYGSALLYFSSGVSKTLLVLVICSIS